MKKVKNIILIVLAVILLSSTISYGRFVQTKTKELAVKTTATKETGKVNIKVTEKQKSYIVQEKADKVDIEGNIEIIGNENIEIKVYTSWTTTNEEPAEEKWEELNIEENVENTNNIYKIEKQAGVGNYYLWAKVEYKDELGRAQKVIKSSNVINVILGKITIELEDEKSEYLTGDVKANITYNGEFTKSQKAGYGKTEQEAKAKASEENKSTITIKKEEQDTTYYIYAYAENSSGDSIEITRAINNIDNVKPEINNIVATNKRIIMNLKDAKSGIKAYTVTTSNTEPTTYTKVLTETQNEVEAELTGLKQGTKYYVWVKDGVGNVSKAEVTTQKLAYTLDPTVDTWTKDKVTVKFTNIDNCTLTYNLNEGTTYTYNNEKGIEVTTNCAINYTLIDGEEKVTGTINVKNIDKTAPIVEGTSDYQKITLTAIDEESGIVGYYVTNIEEKNINEVTFTTCTKTNKLTQEITKDHNNEDLIYNNKYYIYVKDQVGNISLTEVTSKIDKIKPELTLTESTPKTSTITVSVNAQDNESGLKGIYKYYVSETKGSFKETPDAVSEDAAYTFTNLKDEKTYYIKIETEDIAGNIGSIEHEEKTKLLTYTDGNIIFTNPKWSNNTQSITITTTTNYKMQYQVIKPEGTLSLENTAWTDIKTGESLEKLKHEDTVYVRLTDGTNYAKTYATYTVQNEMYKKYPTITEEDYKNATYGTFDILTYNVNTQTTKVGASTAVSMAETYNYYVKDITEDNYIFAKTTSYNTEQLDLELSEGQTYKIIILVVNTSGKIIKSSNFTTVIAEDSVVEGTTYKDNRTYIDSKNYTATLPAGFKISKETGEKVIQNGLVMEDENQNEFVWIPVNYAVYDEKTAVPQNTSSTSTYKPMARRQSKDQNSYEGLVYSYSGVKSYTYLTNAGFRIGGNSFIEPSIITGVNDGYTWDVQTVHGKQYDADSSNYNDILGFSSPTELGKYLNNSYTNMVESVNNYGGFYCGRYETTNTNGIAGSKKNEQILNIKNWYELYKAQDSNRNEENIYHNTKSVVSSMMWSSQKDAVLNFILRGEDKSKVTQENIGNKTNKISTSGQFSQDKMNNIHDLASNVYEFTIGSSGNSSRVARGGSYDSSDTSWSSTRNAIPTTTSGPAIGSRMSLYINLTNDITPPKVEIESLKQTSNTIKVTVKAEDKGSGVKSYYYAISKDGNTWSEEIKQDSNEYTFTNLKALTKYYVRIKAEDRQSNISNWVVKEITTNAINLEQGDIFLESIYGADGNGVASLGMKEDYKTDGYFIEYQVVKKGEAFNENGTWTKGNVITNLSETDTIYARLADDSNKVDGYITITLTDLLEHYSNVYTKTTTITDKNGDTATIPAGFKVGTSSTVNTVENGLVIEDEQGNQFVWVPVPDVVYDEKTAIGSNNNYTPMVMYQKGSNKFYEGIYYNFPSVSQGSNANLAYRIGTNGAREPSLATGSNEDGYTWNIENRIVQGTVYDAKRYNSSLNFSTLEEFGKYMNEEYKNMVYSIQKYKGFYMARYSTSFNGNIVQSKINKIPNAGNWYSFYYKQDSNRYEENPYYNSKSVISSMMWGAQYNAMLNWMLRGADREKIFDTTLGNHGDSKIATGTGGNDIINNVIDLGGNVREWSQQIDYTSGRILKGGCYFYNSTDLRDAASAKTSLSRGAENAENCLGSRMSLYIIDEDDKTAPNVTFVEDSTEVTTNSIKIKVNAEDYGTGIDKYYYYISSDGTNYAEHIGYSNSYKLQNLAQKTTYYIKVKVTDKNGNESNILQLDPIITEIFEIQEGDIQLESIYGKNGEGIAYFSLTEEQEKQGYYLEYQKNTLNLNGTWTKNNQANDLVVGDVIYIRATDGINLSNNSYIYTHTVTELETFSDVYTETEEYTDENGDKAYIPKGFKVGTSSINKTIEGGLVIEDESGNQFVWVPVKHAIYDPEDGTIPNNATNAAKNSSAYKPMAKYQKGYSKTSEKQYFEGILYNQWGDSLLYKSYAQLAGDKYALGSSGAREPSLVTGSNINTSWLYTSGTQYDASSTYYKDELGFNSATEFGEYLNSEYTNMVLSVNKYRGLYISRYMISISNGIIESKFNKTIGNFGVWYEQMYDADSNINSKNPYYNSESVTSSMIWGSQWCATLNWILEGKYSSNVYTKLKTCTGKTGINGYSIMNNILDSSREFNTLAANGSGVRIYYSSSRVPSALWTSSPNSKNWYATRISLYIK